MNVKAPISVCMASFVLVGCAAMKFAPASRSIGSAAVRAVSSEQNVTFTGPAKRTVIEKTDQFVEPGATTAPQTLATEVHTSLDQHVRSYKQLNPNATAVTDVDLKWFVIKRSDYGSLKLASDPPEATVICTSHGNTNEGETTINRVYPVDTYEFVLKKLGCKDSYLKVQIEKGVVKQENVRLDCRP